MPVSYTHLDVYKRQEPVISLLYDTGEAHLHISMADFVVYVVVAPPVKPYPVSYTHLDVYKRQPLNRDIFSVMVYDYTHQFVFT